MTKEKKNIYTIYSNISNILICFFLQKGKINKTNFIDYWNEIENNNKNWLKSKLFIKFVNKMSSCKYSNSTLNIWGSQFAHHLSSGGAIKCDDCRTDLARQNEDGPCYVCQLCSQGFCKSCGGKHCCGCCSGSCQYKNSTLNIWGFSIRPSFVYWRSNQMRRL